MSTTSTIATFRAGLITALEAHAVVIADGIQVGDQWQGPDTQAEGIYLTDLTFENELIAFKQARQPRVETYNQTVVIQAMQAAETPTSHADAVDRCMVLFSALEDVIASDDDIAGEMVVQIATGEYIATPVGPGWGGRLSVIVRVAADLV